MASPHFFKIILHSAIEDKKWMIPKKFISEYGKFLSNPIWLKLPDGSEWKVESTTTANGGVWLEHGWQEFSDHYGLKSGSLLVFRFDGNSTFHTLIFDPTCSEIHYSSSNHIGNAEPDQEEHTGSQSSEEVQTKNLEINNSKPEKNGFKIVVKKSYVEGRYNMLIPKHFARRHLNEEYGKLEIENSEGLSWGMSYKWRQCRNVEYVYISSGWKIFAQENQLKEGHILFFQLIKKGHFLFTLEGIVSPSLPISAKNTNVESTITSKNSLFFKVNIHMKSYKNSVLNIPLTFADNHLSSKIHTAKLIAGKKQWKVKMKHYERCFRFSGGWGQFFRQNHLKCGDSCLFELLNKNESCCIFEVTISKKTETFNDLATEFM